MEQTEETNREIQDSKEQKSSLTGHSVQRGLTTSRNRQRSKWQDCRKKMDKKIECFTKVLKEITSKHKNFEWEARGSSKTNRTLVEFSKDSNLGLPSGHQVRDTHLCDTRPFGESGGDNLNQERVLLDHQSFAEVIQKLCDTTEGKSDNRVSVLEGI